MAGHMIWTHEDKEFIRQNWQSSSDREIAVLLSKIYEKRISGRTITRLRADMGLIKLGQGIHQEFAQVSDPIPRNQKRMVQEASMRTFWIVIGVLMGLDAVIRYLLHSPH